jgi:hypothetical protein
MPKKTKKKRISGGIKTKASNQPLWYLPPFTFLRKATNIFASKLNRGLYEVLEYESTLELRDNKGEKATFHKKEKVRYLQNSIIAYQDQAWGDGDILLNYRCTPGTPVDRYRPGYKTYILISLRDVKNKGDIDEFNIQWGIRNGFLRDTELWETDISHPTVKMTIQVVFPQKRPPIRVFLIERAYKLKTPLSQEAIIQHPDGRWLVKWEKNFPRQDERYAIQWKW